MSWSKEDANYEEWYEHHPEYEPELPVCDNCQRPTEPEELTDLGFMACPVCAEEARLIDEADQTCPALYSQVMSADGIKAIRELFKSHAANPCATCEANRKNIGIERESSDSRSSVRAGGEVA